MLNRIFKFFRFKILVPLLIIVIFVSNMTSTFCAETFNSTPKAQEFISIRFNELRLLYANSTKEVGNLPKLIKIYSQYLIILDFVSNTTIEETTGSYNYVLSQVEYNEHLAYLDTMAQEINKLYNSAAFEGESGANPASNSIENKTVEFWLNKLYTGTINFPVTSKTSDVFRNELTHIYTDYVLAMFKILAANGMNFSSVDEVDNSSLDSSRIVNSNLALLSSIYDIYNAILKDTTYWNTITISNYSSNLINDLSTNNPTWLSSIIDKILENNNESNAPGEITIKDANNVLSILTNTQNDNGVLTVEGGGDANLTNLGYILISAGVVNDPFVSKAGNDLYLETVKEFITDEDQWSKATTVIKKAVSMKKPLYIADARETSSTGKTDDAATYRKAFLADALNTISLQDESVYQFSILKGNMQISAVDSNTFEYVQGNTSNSTTTTLSGSTNNNTNSTTTNNNSSSNNLSSGYTTVGTDSIVAGNSEMSKPIMYVASLESGVNSSVLNTEAALYGNTTSLILANAKLDAKSNKIISEAETNLLFVNGLGDIVLADDTIILPAIANPTLYYYDNASIKLESYSNNILGSFNGTELAYTDPVTYGYYPYTAAFMNHLPEVRLAGADDSKLAFTNDREQDKFTLFMYENILDTATLGGYTTYTARLKSANMNGAKLSVQQNVCIPININTFSVGEEGYTLNNSSAFRLFELGQSFSFTNIPSLYVNSNNIYFCKQGVYNSDREPFFPINSSDNRINTLSLTAPLTTSARRYIANSQNGSEWKSTGTFKVPYLIENYIAEALIGTQYSEQLAKNAINSYEDIVQDAPRRFEVFMTGITNDILSLLGRIDNILSMSSGYENKLFARIIQFIDVYYIFVLIIVIIIVAIRFLKNRLSMPYMILLFSVMIACFDLYTTWLPVYIPETYNFFVNDIVEDVSWKAIYNAAENYTETYVDADRVSASGEPKPYTATITLYQLTSDDMETASDRLGVSVQQIKSGDIIFLDQAAGIFIEGNRIKMSLDSALANKTIRGLYKSQWEELALEQNITLEPIEVADINENPYQLRYTNNIDSLDSYYIPYNEFIQSFIDNLNILSSVFNIQRSTFTYDANFSKDAFMVNSYIHSGLFLDPGNWETLKQNIVEDSLIGGNYSVDNIKNIIESKYRFPDDWLGMSNWILTPTDEMKETLWARTLQANGYYENNWTPTDKMNDLISYVNTHTKNFIVNNVEQISYSSDENAIKLISLFATTALCDRASQFGSWLYPNYANSADMELEDVLYASMTTLKDSNMVVEDSLAATLNYVYGILGLILLIIILIFSNIFLFILNYFIPILYLLLGFMVIFKLVVNDKVAVVIKGYTKVSIITLVLYFIFNCSLTIASSLGHHWFALILVALVSFLCCWFLAFTLLSVFTNITDLGNATLKANLLKASNTLTAGTANKFYATFKNMFSKANTTLVPTSFYKQYGRANSIDTMPISKGERSISNSNMQKTYSPYRNKNNVKE